MVEGNRGGHPINVLCRCYILETRGICAGTEGSSSGGDGGKGIEEVSFAGHFSFSGWGRTVRPFDMDIVSQQGYGWQTLSLAVRREQTAPF